MKLIGDIINELVDDEKSIAGPLLKTKVLANKLKNQDLFDWVTNELKGYKQEDNLPDYRRFHANIIGTYVNGHLQYNNQPIPTRGLDRELENLIRSMNFPQSVSNLEELKRENKSGSLDYHFPAEIIGMLQVNWKKMGNPYIQIVNCKKTIPANAVIEILAVVRNNVLDFMLKIDDQFGGNTEIQDLQAHNELISTIMYKTIINTNGDGNVVNSGDNVKIDNRVKITKGNKEQLKSHLIDLGLSEKDADELTLVIDDEMPADRKGAFGRKVNEWVQKMLGKALDGSWQVGIGAAGGLLAESLERYYGLK